MLAAPRPHRMPNSDNFVQDFPGIICRGTKSWRMLRRWLLMVFSWLLVCPGWAQAPPPRLLALVRVPKGTLRGWVHGQYFGIDGLWDYNEAVASREWCWWGPKRTVFQPLPREEEIVVVDGMTLSAFYQDADDYQKCHRWSRGPNGVYIDTPNPYIRRYGSDVGMAFPNHVFLPAYGQFYELFQGGILWRRTGQPVGHPFILGRRRIQGVNDQDVLVMQPKKHQILALGTETELLLLGADLHTVSKLRLGAVRNLRFDSSGERLAVVTRDDRLWILEVTPRRLPGLSPQDRLWSPRADLTPDEFNRLADQWEKKNRRLWWNPQATSR